MKKKYITIKLVRSPITRKPNQSKTLKALGLSKINQEVQRPDNEAIRGMIATVSHLVEVL
ncbi:MAG: 50S ribosomal protein L30 [Bacilli bacterium]|nr:50S ribosomal protein L30 [Bacilli bacterium]